MLEAGHETGVLAISANPLEDISILKGSFRLHHQHMPEGKPIKGVPRDNVHPTDGTRAATDKKNVNNPRYSTNLALMPEDTAIDAASATAERRLYPLRFHPVSLTRAHEEVIDQVVYAIRSGLLEPGDRLPTIEELAGMTSVSKPVIGEAVKVLRQHGVLATKRGVQGGVTVLSDEIPTSLMRIANGWREATLTELVEARKPIELEIALLAGERGTADDFRAMQESLMKVRRAYGRGSQGSFLRYDHLFHYQIGLAAKSEKLAYFQHRILTEIAATLYDYELFHEDLDLVIATHEAMLDALDQRDPDAIRAAVDDHWKTSSGAFANIEEITSG